MGIGLGPAIQRGGGEVGSLKEEGNSKKTLIIDYYLLVASHTLARVIKQSFLASNHYHLLHFCY
jgi:hypothetical protein